MRKYFLFAVLAINSLVAFSQTRTWTNDPVHSRLGFTVKHLTVSEIDGRFADFNVKVTTTKADYSDARIELTAQIASIDTDVEARDKHLRSADFFDADNYPTLTFKSKSLIKVNDNMAKLAGELTFRGITKPVTLDVVYFGTVTNPMSKKEVAGFKITGSINRLDFGIGASFPEMVVGNDIKITANVEFGY